MTTTSLALEARKDMGAGPLTERFDEALAYASRHHREQFRKGSRVPYMSHLMSVSALVLEHGGSEDQAIAALLHDAVEDAPAGQGPAVLAEIRERFGAAVATIVEACSDGLDADGNRQGSWPERKLPYVAGLRDPRRSRTRPCWSRPPTRSTTGHASPRTCARTGRASGRPSTPASTNCSGTTRASTPRSPTACRTAPSPRLCIARSMNCSRPRAPTEPTSRRTCPTAAAAPSSPGASGISHGRGTLPIRRIPQRTRLPGPVSPASTIRRDLVHALPRLTRVSLDVSYPVTAILHAGTCSGRRCWNQTGRRIRRWTRSVRVRPTVRLGGVGPGDPVRRLIDRHLRIWHLRHCPPGQVSTSAANPPARLCVGIAWPTD